MKRSLLSGIGSLVLLSISLTLFDSGCKKDDSPTTPGGGGGLPTFSFATAGQTFTVPLSGGAARARLTGGTLPYLITGLPNGHVASAGISHDTLTVYPVSPGSTSIMIADSLGAQLDRVVIITITVTGSSSTNYGSGTITVSSSAGNLSISGTGVWPIQAGPSVLAVYDTSMHFFFVYGYQRVSGSNYNIVALLAGMQTRVDTGTYQSPVFFGAGYNVDTTSHVDTLAYSGQSGSIRVNAVSGSNAAGTYSFMARKGTGQLIQFTGTFNVTFVVGVMPENRAALGRESRPSAF